jgi:hypothetical protein
MSFRGAGRSKVAPQGRFAVSVYDRHSEMSDGGSSVVSARPRATGPVPRALRSSIVLLALVQLTFVSGVSAAQAARPVVTSHADRLVSAGHDARVFIWKLESEVEQNLERR